MKLTPRNKGIFFLMLSSFCFACMAAFVRLAGDVPTIQKSFFRNIVALAVALMLLFKNHQGIRPAHRENIPMLFCRSLFGTIGILFNFYAVDHLMLSDASMLNKMSPFFAVIASCFLLKEKIRLPQILILLGAFFGALFVVKPTLSNMALVPSLIGLSGGLCAGIAYTYVRKLGLRGEKGPVIVFTFSAFSCLVALPFLIFDYSPMTLSQTLCLLGAGLAATGGQFSITAAYCNAPAREISVYDYSQVIFSALLGRMLFGDRPDAFSLLGYGIICGMAFCNYRYNREAS